MPWWLERLVLRNAGIEYVPVLTCVGGALAVWWWQRSRAPRGAEGGGDGRVGGGPAVRVGWGPGLAVVALVLLALAWLGHAEGMWLQVWTLVQDDAWLAAWWVMGVGVTVGVWGVAVHAWRGESRLARRCRCGYDMTGVNGLKCPECGREARSERALRPFNVRRWALWCGGVVVCLGLLLPTGMSVAQRGLAAALPDRTLLWWVCSTGRPPAPVMRDVIFRAGKEPAVWRARITGRSRVLAERLMESVPPETGEYGALLAEARSIEAGNVALANLHSPDAQRHRNAAELLGLLNWPLPLVEVEALMADNDPATRANGQRLLTWATGEIVQRLAGVGGPKETDPRRVRELVRLLALTPPGAFFSEPGQLDGVCASPDAETAAVAALVRNRWGALSGSSSAAMLRAALVGQRTLRELKLAPVAGGVSLGPYLWDPARAALLTPLLEDPDASVRAELLAELDTATAAMAGYYLPGNREHWSPLWKPVRERAGHEPDAAQRALLEKIADLVEGKAGGQAGAGGR